jgi:branched-chain amino acid transport system substrate-binding protein
MGIETGLKRGVVAAALLLLGLSAAAVAATVGPVTDEIGVVKIPKGAPIQIGGYWVLSGADAALGTDQKRGAELGFADHGNKIAGHPVKLVIEDGLCSAEGGQTAATKLAANPAIVLVIGPSCSSEATPGAPILWQAGIVSIGTSCGAPSLTDPNRKPAYGGFARTIFNDLETGAADARWLKNVLKAQTAVTVHDGSPYAQQLAQVMAKNFRELGGKVLSEEAISPTDVDMHPLLTRIATEKPDVLYLPIFVGAAGQILRQAKDVPGLEKTTIIGGSSLAAADMIEAAGASVVGFRISYPDVSPDAMGKKYPRLIEEYKAKYGEAPISGYHGQAYDAAEIAVRAIEKVAVTDKDGVTYIGRKAVRDAVFSAKFDGMSGAIECDQNGQCGKLKFAVYQFTSADPKTFKIGENPKKIFP